jgi:short-subunit dehydrogenase
MFEVNLFGVMEMVKQFSPLLIAASGTIVNHGSKTTLLHLFHVYEVDSRLFRYG